jgi:hypothetical protein
MGENLLCFIDTNITIRNEAHFYEAHFYEAHFYEAHFYEAHLNGNGKMEMETEMKK